MNSSSSRKPTLLSGSAPVTGSNRILASLERRQPNAARPTTVNFGRRRSDRLRPLRIITNAMVLAAIGFGFYTAYTTVHQPADRIQAAAQTHPSVSVISSQTTPPAVTTSIPTGTLTTDANNTATIINISAPQDLPQTASAVLATPIAQVTSTSVPTQHAAAMMQPEAIAPATDATMHNTGTTAATTHGTAKGVTSNDKFLVDKSIDKHGMTLEPPSAMPVGTDSDVDLLAALIARARQRDPAAETKAATPSCVLTDAPAGSSSQRLSCAQ